MPGTAPSDRNPSGVYVFVIDALGTRRVAGPAVDPNSLALSGSTVSWTSGGQPGSATGGRAVPNWLGPGGPAAGVSGFDSGPAARMGRWHWNGETAPKPA
jgi:hypothetical protein